MKSGKTIVELAQEIMRQQETRKDFLVAADAIRAVATTSTEGKRSDVTLTFGDQEVGINEIAHDQIGEYLHIPAKYYDRMRAEAPDLLVANINRWLTGNEERRMVRTLDGKARALLSDKYRPLDNAELFEAIFPAIQELGVEIMSADVTERRMYIKAVDRRILKDMPSGAKFGEGHTIVDTLSPGISISNSEVGEGTLQVMTSVFKRACTNLMTIDVKGSLRKYHVGARADIGEDVYKLLSPETRQVTDKALWLQARDVIKGAFDKARFDALVDEKLLGLTTELITGAVPKVVEIASKKFGWNETESNSVLANLIKGGDLTRWGFVNAVTAASQEVPDYDRATEFERLGGKIVELPKGEWEALATAA